MGWARLVADMAALLIYARALRLSHFSTAGLACVCQGIDFDKAAGLLKGTLGNLKAAARVVARFRAGRDAWVWSCCTVGDGCSAKGSQLAYPVIVMRFNSKPVLLELDVLPLQIRRTLNYARRFMSHVPPSEEFNKRLSSWQTGQYKYYSVCQ